jgi:ABC-type branched-subunit amino acid transport system substrate-binding protein
MKNIKKVLIFLGILILIGIIVSVYLSRCQNGEIKIGVLAPLSGEYAVTGENMEKGIELAKDMYLEKHPNMKVQLYVEDDGFDVKKGISAYKKLTGIDNVDTIISLSTPVIDAIYDDVVKSNNPFMQIGIQTRGLGKDNIFQMSPLAEAGIYDLADYLSSHYEFKKTAVYYDNTAGGISFYDAFTAKYHGKYDSFIINNKSDLRNYSAKVVKEGYDSVVFLTSSENGAVGVKEILAITRNVPSLIFDAQLQTGWADYSRILGDTNKINGAITFWFKGGDTEAFKNGFKNKYNEEPGFIADFGYDTFNTLMNAYNKDGKKWQGGVQNTNTVGASGGIKFDDNGVRIQEININVVKDGKIVPVK